MALPETQLLPVALEELKLRFGTEPKPVIAAFAPGRVNIIGEHTDYNEGFVFPMAIGMGTIVMAVKAPTTTCTVWSCMMKEEVSFDLNNAGDVKEEEKGECWHSYVKGSVYKFMSKFPQDLAQGAVGFNAVINGNMPVGGGLSSSASLEVAIITMLEELFGHRFKPEEKAVLAQQAEREFAGVPCGIMDQMIAVQGKPGMAMLLDCRDFSTTMVPLGSGDTKVVITNSMVKHNLHGTEYPLRVQQCSEAVAAIGKHFNTTFKSLRDVTIEQLQEAFNAGHMSELAFRRSRHVITEDTRTEAAVEAFKNKDMEAAGRFMNDSHDSLQKDYEVSCKELDILVEIARVQNGVYGTRMTGAGFGGCIVSLVKASEVDAVEKTITEQYKEKTGIDCVHTITEPAAGARRVDLGYLIPEQHVMESISRAKELKADGNALFKEGKLKKALDKYHRMHFHIGGLIKKEGGMAGMMRQEKLSDEEKTEVTSLLGSMHMNKSMCYVKLEKWDKGLEACTTALSVGGVDEGKCLYRRGICYRKVGELSKAKVDLDAATLKAPSDVNIQKELKALASDRKASEDKAKKTYAKMFG